MEYMCLTTRFFLYYVQNVTHFEDLQNYQVDGKEWDHQHGPDEDIFDNVDDNKTICKKYLLLRIEVLNVNHNKWHDKRIFYVSIVPLFPHILSKSSSDLETGQKSILNNHWHDFCLHNGTPWLWKTSLKHSLLLCSIEPKFARS